MKLYRLSSGDSVFCRDKTVIVSFAGKRKVLSTSIYNGGIHDHFTYVFNHDSSSPDGAPIKMTMDTYKSYMLEVAKKLRLDPKDGTGMSTVAQMDNISIKSATYQMLTVTALVTAGIEVNGGRVGDPATYFRVLGKGDIIPSGTINIILYVDGNVNDGILTRALVTCTEAKVAALQELMADSRYSTGLATGSGTDQTIIVANSDSSYSYDSAGKHSKLGELIGLVVKSAVKEALDKQSHLNPPKQHNIFRRLRRYGITPESLYHRYKSRGGSFTEEVFMACAETVSHDSHLVVQISLVVHLLDQWQWGLLSDKEVWSGIQGLYRDLYQSDTKIKDDVSIDLDTLIVEIEQYLLDEIL